MKRYPLSTLFSFLAGLLLVLMWGYAAFNKLFTYNHFTFQLSGHPLLAVHAGLLAWLVPAVEIIICLMLVSVRFRRSGLISSLILLGLFTGYIIYMFNFYPHEPCSCGGIIGLLSWWQHVIFNLVFMLIAWAGLADTGKGSAPLVV